MSSDGSIDYLHEPAQPQPREGARVESGTSIEEAERLAAIETDAVFGPAQPQPRGEGDAEKTRGYTREDIQANTWWPGKGGEGDDLAARLEDAATTAQRIGAKHREEGNSAASSYYRGQRNAYNEAAELARASTHPEQSARADLRVATYHNALYDIATDTEQPGSRKASRLQEIARKTLAISFRDVEQAGTTRVDPAQLALVRNMAKIEASQSDPEQAPAFTDERRASHRRRADALNAVLAALEPASPTPTEQENDR